MVAPPIEHSAPGPGEEADDEEYESDIYDVEDDEEDIDYEGEEDDDDEDEEERGVVSKSPLQIVSLMQKHSTRFCMCTSESYSVTGFRTYPTQRYRF